MTKTAPETTPPVDPEAAHENVLSDTKTEDKAPRGKYSVKTANDNTFMFNLKAVNGEIIATSQTYTSKASSFIVWISSYSLSIGIPLISLNIL